MNDVELRFESTTNDTAEDDFIKDTAWGMGMKDPCRIKEHPELKSWVRRYIRQNLERTWTNLREYGYDVHAGVRITLLDYEEGFL